MIQHHYVEQLERDLEAMKKQSAALKISALRLKRESIVLRMVAEDMADEMELHGGEQAFYSLARYRAEMRKEATP